MTLGIINQLNDREGSTVLVGKQEIHEAPQIALSDQLEHLDNDHAYIDKDCEKFNEPVRTV